MLKNNLRIIAGKYRGRRLPFPDAEGLRPTPNRVRETLFNWLMPYIKGARCLDAFAGSGALTFEALSRGASEVVALEKNKVVYQSLQACAQTFGETNLILSCVDSLNWLNKTPVHAFDIIFLDPPFAADLLANCFKTLASLGWLAPNGLVYCEQTKFPSQEEIPLGWKILKQEKAGALSYGLLQNNKSGEC